MATKIHSFKTFEEQIVFENTLSDDAAYESLSDPINKVYETTVETKEKVCPRCKGTGKVKA